MHRRPACSTSEPRNGRRRSSTGSTSGTPCFRRSSLPAPGVARTSAGIPVTTVGSHDTAFAVVAVPADRPPVRLCRQRDVVVGRTRAGTPGADGRCEGGELHQRSWRRWPHGLLPRNVGGLWLLQVVTPCLEPESWIRCSPRRQHSPPAGRPSTSMTTGSSRPGTCQLESPRRSPGLGGDHRRRRVPQCGASSTPSPPCTPAPCDAPATLAGVEVEVVHIIGGGSQNELLCQQTADRCGLPVVAGPMEATALGNIAVQASRPLCRARFARGNPPHDRGRRCRSGSTSQREPVPHAALGHPLRAVETDPVERRLARAASVADLRRIAKRRLPGGVFDYIDGGAEDERTLAANQAAFASVTFRPRVLRGLEKVAIGSTLFGQPLAYPSCSRRRLHPDRGSRRRARRGASAERAGLPYTLSTSAPDRSRRSARSATVGCGSRSTPGGTEAWCRR